MNQSINQSNHQSNHSFLFWEKHSPDDWEQLLKDQFHSWVQWIVSHDGAVIASQKHASDNIFVGIFQTELTQRQFRFHFLSCLVGHDFAKRFLTFSKDWLGDLSVFGSDFNCNISFHHSQHTLLLMDFVLGRWSCANGVSTLLCCWLFLGVFWEGEFWALRWVHVWPAFFWFFVC